MKRIASLFCIWLVTTAFPSTWTADNGNGTFTNPLFYDEFSDPDLIRVGEDYYLTGTTMHTMPGLPVPQVLSTLSVLEMRRLIRRLSGTTVSRP